MNVYTAIAIQNVSIILTICTISVLGFLVLGSAAGLWSMLLVFALASGKDDDKKKDGSGIETLSETDE